VPSLLKSPSKKGSSERLPVVSWRDVLKALHKRGYNPIHQRGSHIYVTDGKRLVTVPRHDEMKPGTLLQIIKDSGLTKEEFIGLLK